MLSALINALVHTKVKLNISFRADTDHVTFNTYIEPNGTHIENAVLH